MLTILECFDKLKKMPIAKAIVLKSDDDLIKIKFPYYMKASIAEHKLEKKAVLRIENIDDAKQNYSRLVKQFPKSPIIIQEQVVGVEMIIGLKEDTTFGKLLLVGFGGTNAEVLKDVGFLAVPASREDILKSLSSLKLFDTLHKRKLYAIDKFVDLAYEVSKTSFKELDLNPVILSEDKAIIVDARGEI
jgi:hypothetical protein